MPEICLIAESDPFITRLLDRFAIKSGLATLHAQTGQDVLDSLQHHRPSVMILDPELPGKTRGWEVMQSLPLDPTYSLFPVIACTWQSPDECIRQFGEFDSYLQKPALHFEDFLAALTQAGVAFRSDEALLIDPNRKE